MDKHPVDIMVGDRVRLARLLKNWSKKRVADLIGMTYQSVDKHERAEVGIRASRLWEYSQALNVPVQWFFESIPGGAEKLDDDVAEWDVEAIQAGKLFMALTHSQREATLAVMREMLQLNGTDPQTVLSATEPPSEELAAKATKE